MNKPLRLALALFTVLALTGCGAEAETRQTFFAMSTVVTMSVSGGDAERACEAAEERLGELEAATSRFERGSDISRINAAAGSGEVEIGRDAYDILLAAKAYAAESGGAFDVSVGALTSLWGIGGDDARVPAQSEIDAALALVNIDDLSLETRAGKYYAALARAGQKLDLGGCAKGYALDLCRETLAQCGVDSGFVSLGGNVMLLGDNGGEGFTVGVRYPEQASSGSLCILRLSETCVATTGAYERFFEKDGVSYHHVLDVETGYPAESDVLSASVVCENGMRGDYLSTRLFLLGVEGALELMRSGGVDAVLVADDNTVYVSRSLEPAFIIESADDNYTFKFV